MRRFTFRVVLPSSVLLGGSYYLYKRRLAENKRITPQEFHSNQADNIARVLATSETLRSQSPLVLYQYHTCPFCNKVKTLLNTQELDYQTVEVDPLFKMELKPNGFGKVPQLRVGDDGPLLVDSEEIVNYLAPLLLPKAAIEENDVPKWRNWANNVLARYLVINTNRNWRESFQGYDYVEGVENFGVMRKLAVKVVGGVTMHLVSEYVTKKRLEPYGYKKGLDERQALYAELESWAAQIQTLHGGERPDLADIEVYGILQSVRGFPLYNEMSQNCPSVGSWMERMDQVIKTQRE